MKLDIESQIKNFVLNICCWQINNSGCLHKMSLHLQDIIPEFVIEKLCVNDRQLYFEGEYIDKDGKCVQYGTYYYENLKESEKKEILKVLKNINLFKS